jgi:hypothetical protein
MHWTLVIFYYVGVILIMKISSAFQYFLHVSYQRFCFLAFKQMLLTYSILSRLYRLMMKLQMMTSEMPRGSLFQQVENLYSSMPAHP